MWTRFMDMHSGGGAKEDFEFLLVELPEREAVVYFYNKFGHNPYRVTCTCCGEDYSVGEDETIQNITGFDRGCRYATPKTPKKGDRGFYIEEGPIPEGYKVDHRLYRSPYISIEDFLNDPEKFRYKIIYRSDISDSEIEGTVPRQGYVWID